MKIDVATTNNNQESEICKFISTINKFDIFVKKIEEKNELCSTALVSYLTGNKHRNTDTI